MNPAIARKRPRVRSRCFASLLWLIRCEAGYQLVRPWFGWSESRDDRLAWWIATPKARTYYARRALERRPPAGA
jgi:hypothetical protein